MVPQALGQQDDSFSHSASLASVDSQTSFTLKPY